MDFVIRNMCEEDLSQVVPIEQRIFSMPWSHKSFLDSIQQESTMYLVAVDKKTGAIAGYCGLYRSFDEADITNVAVDDKYRRNHLAFDMLTQLLKKGLEEGIKAYTLEVRKSNKAAFLLYQKLGFESVGIRKNFYQKPLEDAIIMWKR